MDSTMRKKLRNYIQDTLDLLVLPMQIMVGGFPFLTQDVAKVSIAILSRVIDWETVHLSYKTVVTVPARVSSSLNKARSGEKKPRQTETGRSIPEQEGGVEHTSHTDSAGTTQ